MTTELSQLDRGVPASSELPRYAATDLTCGNDLAEIVLGDKIYRLRITKAEKLILTK